MADIDEQVILDKLMAGATDEPNITTTSSEDKVEASTDKVSDQVEASHEEASSSSSTLDSASAPAGKPGKDAKDDNQEPEDRPVSYKRFRQIWSQAKGHERKIKELEAALEQARQASSGGKPDAQQPDDIDALIDRVAFGDHRETDPVQELRVQIQADRLEREQEKVSAEFPDVPMHLALRAVADNPRLSLKEAASAISAQLGAYEEYVLNKHRVAKAPVVASKPKPEAPPDLQGRSGATSDRGRSGKPPSNYDDLEASVLRSLGL